MEGVFFDGNKPTKTATGYEKEELIGKNLMRLNLLRLRQVPKAAVNLARNTLGYPTGPDEFRVRRKDGTEVPLEISTFPVRIMDRSLVLGISRDITERKRAEEALRNAHDDLEVRVQERTVELAAVNDALQSEVAERKRAHEQIQTSLREKEVLLKEIHHRV